jgi:hypothetical protein
MASQSLGDAVSADFLDQFYGVRLAWVIGPICSIISYRESPWRAMVLASNPRQLSSYLLCSSIAGLPLDIEETA